MSYSVLKETWSGLAPYTTNSRERRRRRQHHRHSSHSMENKPKIIGEGYGGPVTLPLDQWREYVASGKNTLYGSGGVIPGGTMTTPFGGNGAVFAGNVRQGIQY